MGSWNFPWQVSSVMEFSREAYWSGLTFPSPGYLSNPGIKTMSVVSPTLAGRFFTTVPPGKCSLEYCNELGASLPIIPSC